MYEGREEIVGKCINTDILTFLGLDYRDASIMTLYYVDLGISILKIRLIG